MTRKGQDNVIFDAAVIGAGVAGIAAAYYLSLRGHKVALIDKLPPLSFTSAQSGENYRNWWPHPTMTAFTNDSISLMESLSRETENCFAMTRKGYLLASRKDNANSLIKQLHEGYGADIDAQIRIHSKHSNSGYTPNQSTSQAQISDWTGAIDGVDVLDNIDLIREHYPHLDPEVRQLIHIRRAGEVSFYPLGQFMLSKIRERGGRLFQGKVIGIDHCNNANFTVHFSHNNQNSQLNVQKLVNAAGPFATEVADLLGASLPITNVLQQKIAFEDRENAIPRDMPFTVDLDDCILKWDEEDRKILSSDSDTCWLTKPIRGSIHCRPDGSDTGRWIKLGWAYNKAKSHPNWEPELDPLFPDLVLRGASRLHKGLEAYLGKLPRNALHYGGYYSMTDENWPIIGPMGPANTYVIGALSGFGTMSACGAGSLITSWIMGDALPDYAKHLSLERYNDTELMQKLKTLSTGAL